MNKHNKSKPDIKNHLKKAWNWIGKQNVFFVIFVFFLLIYFVSTVYSNYINDNSNRVNNPDKVTNTNDENIKSSVKDLPAINLKPSSTTAPTPKLIKEVKTNNDSEPLKPDDPVHCSIHSNCGGGTIPLTQAECSTSTCCQLSDGTWKFFKSTNECEKARSEGRNYQYQPQDHKTESADFPPCILNGNVYTYIDPATCDQWKKQDQELNQQYNANLETDYDYSINSQDTGSNVEECKAYVRSEYQLLIQNCHNQFGASSAGEYCVSMREKERDTALSNC